ELAARHGDHRAGITRGHVDGDEREGGSRSGARAGARVVAALRPSCRGMAEKEHCDGEGGQDQRGRGEPRGPRGTHEAPERYQTRFRYTGGHGMDQPDVGSGKRHRGSSTPLSRLFNALTSPALMSPRIVSPSRPRSNSTRAPSTSPHISPGSCWPEKSHM